MTLQASTITTPIGVLTLLADAVGLRRVLFENQGIGDICISADADDRARETLERTSTQLDEYFAGQRRAFDLPLHLIGTDFQRTAWLALDDIGYGQTSTYGRQAANIGRPGASRAVGAANGANPVPIVLGCHRVVGADGKLTGFGGGLAVKRWLLDFERGTLALALFDEPQH